MFGPNFGRLTTGCCFILISISLLSVSIDRWTSAVKVSAVKVSNWLSGSLTFTFFLLGYTMGIVKVEVWSIPKNIYK